MDACESYDYNPGSIIRHKNNSTKKLHAGGNLGRGVRRLEPQAPAVADRMQFFILLPVLPELPAPSFRFPDPPWTRYPEG